MADWKQITARIRRARTGKDPAGQLSNLFEKTRDAMVAFELARYFETAGQSAEAAKWYSTAAERFRRSDWKLKAEEAVVRLGGSPTTGAAAGALAPAEAPIGPVPMLVVPEPGAPFEETATTFEAITQSSAEESSSVTPESSERANEERPAEDKKRRRRGRRGGRNRRKSGAPHVSSAPVATSGSDTAVSRPKESWVSAEESLESPSGKVAESTGFPAPPVEALTDAAGPMVRGRYGDPGLSSRLSLLEMQFRRLLTCAPAKLSESDRAPLGPGVFLLTDSDLTTYYYAEACQTLRIAIANLLRGGSSHRGADSIKPQLAEHLGIAESRVAKYLTDHCVVRWLQLDEGASHFAHFVIAVLRPTLNE
jgi:hypothetical protein